MIMASKSFIVLVLCLCIGAGFIIAGCTQQSTPVSTTTATPTSPSTTQAAEAGAGSGSTSNQTGLANPASVNCGNIGGTTEIMTNTDGGQYGMCTFPNGTTCEEWALFRGEGCKAANVTA
jgi:hypothetical protein